MKVINLKDLKTSIGYPYALIKFGDGTKLAFLQTLKIDTNDGGTYFIGRSFRWDSETVVKGHRELYRTVKKIFHKDIIHRWRRLPSINGLNRVKQSYLKKVKKMHELPQRVNKK